MKLKGVRDSKDIHNPSSMHDRVLMIGTSFTNPLEIDRTQTSDTLKEW